MRHAHGCCSRGLCAMERARHCRQLTAIRIAIYHCVDLLAQLVALIYVRARLDAVLQHPLALRLRIAIARAAAFVVGSAFLDEQLEFSKVRLVRNDAYRDRLLEPEIADLVDVSEALHMTLAQRKALFRCFLHLDFARRSTISRLELLRYCNLRASPLAAFLLPVSAVATHRPVIAKRWDISQFFAACFSVCTADPAQLVCAAIAEAIRPPADAATHTTSAKTEAREVRQQSSFPLDHIEKCVQFFIGAPSPLEKNLVTLLGYLYNDVITVDFKVIHQVETILDVVVLFPVLVFPCLWIHRVLRARTLGSATWHALKHRRAEIQNTHPDQQLLFMSFSDIVSAPVVQHGQQKQGLEAHRLRSHIKRVTSRIKQRANFAKQQNPLIAPIISKKVSERSNSSSSRRSTPRKILPDVVDPSTVALESLIKMTRKCSTLTTAWEVTATNLLASVHLLLRVEDKGSASIDDLASHFTESSNAIFEGSLPIENCWRIYKRIAFHHGYQFAREMFSKSSLAECITMSKATPEQRRARDRYAKAWRGAEVPDDNRRYWKQFVDPVEEQAFYYNVRTGESQWERPASYVENARRRKTKKKRQNETPQ